MSLVSRIYQGATSVANSLYQGASSLGSSIKSNPVTTFGLIGVNIGGTIAGEVASTLTRGWVQLNTVVPHPIRNLLRGVGGSAVGGLNQLVSSVAAGILRVNNNAFFRSVIAAPIVEELIFRLPLLIAAGKIDSLTSEFITSALLEGVIDMTGGTALKIALAAIISIGFTYAHSANPSPGRAMGLFSAGMTYSHLTLRPTGGLLNSMVAHAINNLFATMVGSINGTTLERDIHITLPHNGVIEEEEIQEDNK